MNTVSRLSRISFVIGFMLIAAGPLCAAVHEFDLPDHGLVRAEIVSITDESVTFLLSKTGEQIEVAAGEFRKGYYEFLKLRYQLEQKETAPAVNDLLEAAGAEDAPETTNPEEFRTWKLSAEGRQRFGRDNVEARLLELVTGRVKLQDRRGNAAMFAFEELAPEEMRVLQDWFLEERANRMSYFKLQARLLVRDVPPTELPGPEFAEMTDPADPEAGEGPFSKPEGNVDEEAVEYGWFEIQFLSRAPLPLEDVKAVVHVVKKRRGPGVDSCLAMENTWTEGTLGKEMTAFRTYGIPLYKSQVSLEEDQRNLLLPTKIQESLFGLVVKVYAGEKLIHLHAEPSALFRQTEWETPNPLAPPKQLVLPVTSGEAEVLRKYLPEAQAPNLPPKTEEGEEETDSRDEE